jgi:hypothetical protein
MFPPVIGGRSTRHLIPATRNGFSRRAGERRARSSADPGDVLAQSGPICAPQSMIVEDLAAEQQQAVLAHSHQSGQGDVPGVV